MAKKLKDALGTSLKAEERSVKDRFNRAENVFLNDKNKKLQTENTVSVEKVVRDSFTMPSQDHSLINQIKTKCLKAGISVTKSEVVRAGFQALNRLSEEELLEIFSNLYKVKPGRPPK